MLKCRVGFVVFGVHKDGLKDPMGEPFIDEGIVKKSKNALKDLGMELVESDIVISSKKESMEVIKKIKNDESIDALILFSGTWVWAANLISSIRDFEKSGKSIVIWTHPGSQGWRPVGGLVMSGALKEIGIKHRFIYCTYDDFQIKEIASYCTASAMKRKLEGATVCAFGGRGMGQTCGVADPSQWMKMFGIDIDTRDTTLLTETARNIQNMDVENYRLGLTKWFDILPEDNESTRKSIRLYLALKELKSKLGFDYYTIQSFPGLGDEYSATCFAQSMMMEDGVATSTLSDFNTLLCSILLTELGSERMYYGDLQHIDKKEKEIKIIGDGAIPPSLAGKLNNGKATFAEHGIPTEGSAGGISVNLVAKSGKGVLARLGRENGKFKMILVSCEVFEPDLKDIDKRLLECGIPFWPHAFVKVDCDMEMLLNNWNNEYACLGYGESLYSTIRDFCEQTDIELVLL